MNREERRGDGRGDGMVWEVRGGRGEKRGEVRGGRGEKRGEVRGVSSPRVVRACVVLTSVVISSVARRRE